MKKFYEKKEFGYLAIAIVVINLIMTFVVVVPSLAASNNNIDFNNQPLNNTDTISVFDGNNNFWQITNSTEAQIYICASMSGVGGEFICFTQSDGTDIPYLYIQLQDGRQYRFAHPMIPVVYNNQTWYLYYTDVMFDNSSIHYITVPYYDNIINPSNNQQTQNFDVVIQDALSTGNGGNNGGNTESSTLNYNLPAGNVAYIEIGDGTPNISMMSTVMPVKSAAFSSQTGWNSTQRVGFAESLPSGDDNLASFGTQIEWIPNGNTNIFGQTQNAKFTAPSLSGHKYLVVVNPLYYAIQYTNGEGIASNEPGVNSTVNNNAVNIFMNYSKGITVYQLTQNVTINNNIPTYTNDVSSGPYEGDIDPETGDVTWTDPDGGSSQPTTGGGNVPGTGENNFSSFLSGVANRIVNVFQPAHDAILTLSNAVQNIAGWMYALYVWLPAPVLSILTSAISLAIIIGLIKVFV